MGRLNASDSSSSSSSDDGGGKRSAVVVVEDDTNTSVNKNTATTTSNNSHVDVRGSDHADDNNSEAVATDRGVESNKHEQDATLKHSTAALLTSPISLERTTSVVSVSSSSVVTNPIVQSSNNTTCAGVVANKISSSTAKPAVAAASAAASMNNESSSSSSFNNKSSNIVTSLDWKSSNEPILLATCGTNVCIWDLNVVGSSGSSSSGRSAAAGIRPNLRFAPPNDELYHPGSYLIHCAYSSQQCGDDDYDYESKEEKGDEEEARKHTFATLNNLGVVRIWDDRKAGNCPLHSFMACPGGGVGIASLSPCKSRLRWVTWGMDDNDDDLVVKVLTESSSSTSPSTTKSRANTSETATASSTDAYTSSDQPRAYNMTSRFAVAGAVAARVHSSYRR